MIKPAPFELNENQGPQGEGPSIIEEDLGEIVEQRVMKGEAPFETRITEFEFPKLHATGPQGYSAVKAKYGPLAATDPDRHARTRKDSRFLLNPLLRDPLSVEEEEKRVIEEKVRVRIEAISAEARERASEVGFQEGLKKAYADAYQRFRDESSGHLKRIEEFLASAEEAKKEIFRENERFLIELVYQIAKTVLLKELATDKQYVQRLAQELIERVGLRENIRLRIHPDDAKSLAALKQNIEQAFAGMKNLNVEVSELVKLGGCQIETQWNAIDASLETQLKSVYESLVGAKAADPAGAADAPQGEKP